MKTGKQEMITVDDMLVGLRTKDLTFNDKETFVRTSFDELFDGFQLIEHYLGIQLISFDDVKEPLGYYVQRLDEHRDAVNNCTSRVRLRSLPRRSSSGSITRRNDNV